MCKYGVCLSCGFKKFAKRKMARGLSIINTAFNKRIVKKPEISSPEENMEKYLKEKIKLKRVDRDERAIIS